MTAARIALAAWLVDAGAGESARCVLASTPGFAAGKLRGASEAARLGPGIYALVVLADGTGVVAPLRPEPGHSRSRDPAFRGACSRASERVRQVLRAPSIPDHRFELEDVLEIDGDSVGLAAFLSIVASMSTVQVRRPVLVTGALDVQGRVRPVGHTTVKIDAALRERSVTAPLILTPVDETSVPGSATAVDRDLEALALVFGTRSPPIDARRVDLQVVLAEARRTSPLAAVELLRAVDSSSLPVADRCQLALELGTALRHAGLTAEATFVHERARELLSQSRRVLGAEASERYRIELAATQLDVMQFAAVAETLVQQLESPFASLHNELRARGLLAQALGMAGAFAEAVEVRRQNLSLHELSSDLARTRAGTLCYLALDAARAGDRTEAERHIAALVRATRPGDAEQWRYSGAAVVRSLVHLARPHEAVAFASGQLQIEGVRADRSFVEAMVGHAPVTTHPETSALRSLLRAYRQTQSRTATETAIARAAPGSPGSGLLAWVLGVTQLEASLGLDALGRATEAETLRQRVRAEMRREHAAATDVHQALFGETMTLPSAIDRVWY